MKLSNAARHFLASVVGMQVLFEDQEEGDAQGLGLLPGSGPLDPATLKKSRTSAGTNRPFAKPLPRLEPGDAFYYYFVHSFVAEPADPADVAATTEYGEQFASVVVRNNVWGTQFHPEKSSEDGLALIKSWVDQLATILDAIRSECRSMILYPAIDIRGGRCVRLVEGDFDRETAFDADPVDAATTLGGPPAPNWIHVVDLDGCGRGRTGQSRRHRPHSRRGRYPDPARRRNPH